MGFAPNFVQRISLIDNPSALLSLYGRGKKIDSCRQINLSPFHCTVVARNENVHLMLGGKRSISGDNLYNIYTQLLNMQLLDKEQS